MSEIRYAFRTLIKAPGPTLVMMLTLGVSVVYHAIGIDPCCRNPRLNLL